MKPEQDILAALRALAESDRDVEAPPEVEARLRLAFRGRHARRPTGKTWKRAAIWGLAAAAAVAALVTSYAWRPRVTPVEVTAIQRPTVPPVPEIVKAAEPVPIARVKTNRPRIAAPARREVVTEFFPLDDAPPVFERGALVRVNLPASAMRRVGLPVREDRLADVVQADVLVGQEGLARAIRFVKYSQ